MCVCIKISQESIFASVPSKRPTTARSARSDRRAANLAVKGLSVESFAAIGNTGSDAGANHLR